MSKASSSKTSQTDWPRLKAMQDTDVILTDEHPAAEVQHIVRGITPSGLTARSPKTLISLRVDARRADKRRATGLQGDRQLIGGLGALAETEEES